MKRRETYGLDDRLVRGYGGKSLASVAEVTGVREKEAAVVQEGRQVRLHVPLPLHLMIYA